MPISKERKREIIERGVRSLLEDAKVPMRQHLKALKELRERTDLHGADLREWKKNVDAWARIVKLHERSMAGWESEIEGWRKEAARLTSIERLRGQKGDSVDFDEVVQTVVAMLPRQEMFSKEQVVAALIPFIPEAVKGADAVIDKDQLISELIEKIKKDKSIDISDVRNAQTFMFNKKKYNIHELMRGAGGGSTSGGLTVTTQYLLTALASGADVTIDLTQLANWATFNQAIAIYRNNVPQTETVNFSISSNLLTIFNADASEVFNVTYSYE